MNEFMTEQIELSMRNPETGRQLTANVYTLEGVTAPDGSPRIMSIGQLVMAICLNRAVAMEDKMVGMMAEMEVNTDNLTALTRAETLLQNGTKVDATLSEKLVYYEIDTETYVVTKKECTKICDFLDQFKNPPVEWKGLSSDKIVTNIETKMDGLNTFSQQKMIELQSYTNKRDQAYDLISNMLKSFNTVLHANANNL